MADTKISELPAATTPLAGTEVLPIVQSGITEQVSVANLTAGRAVTGASFQGGNILMSGNTIQAQNTNGSISVLPNGTGFTKVALEKYSNTAGTVVLSAATPMRTMAQLTLGAGTWILIGTPGGVLSSGVGQAGDTQTYTINTSAAIPAWNSNVAARVKSYYPQAVNEFIFYGGSISLQVTLASSTTYYLYGGLNSITVSLEPVLNGTLYAVKISE
jgi:hypothetical protein